jgi:5-(carboxyamino)imidazole ribonucleotide mutase
MTRKLKRKCLWLAFGSPELIIFKKELIILEKKPKVAVVMGSDSDFSVLKPGIKFLKDFGVEVDVLVCSAHRTPDHASQFAKDAEKNGYSVIIAGAGKAAHLPGVLAAYTVLPVIGVPIQSKPFDGMDALLSIVQMPQGIPVASVAVDGSVNAGILAAQVLATGFPILREKLKAYKIELAKKVEQKNKDIQIEVENL